MAYVFNESNPYQCSRQWRDSSISTIFLTRAENGLCKAACANTSALAAYHICSANEILIASVSPRAKCSIDTLRRLKLSYHLISAKWRHHLKIMAGEIRINRGERMASHAYVAMSLASINIRRLLRQPAISEISLAAWHVARDIKRSIANVIMSKARG